MMADADVKPATTGTDTNSTRKPASKRQVLRNNVTYCSYLSFSFRGSKATVAWSWSLIYISAKVKDKWRSIVTPLSLCIYMLDA
jgi:hypothetical protein